MSLRNDETQLFDFNGNMVTPSTTLFAQAKRRLDMKKMALEDMQNEYDLLEQQAFNLYKSHVSYTFFEDGIMKNVKAWLSMQKSGKDSDGKKLDGRKKYKEKDLYEFFVSKLKEYLGIEDIEIIQIMEYNFGEADEIVFNYCNHKWMLSIPTIKGIRMKSFRSYGENVFKLQLHHYDSDHCTSYVGDTYSEDELASIMKLGIAKFIVE